MPFNPEIYDRLELLIASVGVIFGFFFGLFLLLKRTKSVSANLFLAIYFFGFSLRVSKSLFHNFYEISTTILTIFLGILLLIGPSLLFYTKHLYIKYYSLKWRYYIIHYLPFLVVICTSSIILNSGKSISRVFYFFLFFHGLIYSFYVLIFLLTTASKNKVMKIKTWLLFLTYGTIAMFINSTFIFFDIVPFYPSTAFLFSFVMVVLVVWSLKNPDIFKGDIEKYSNSRLSNSDILDYMNQLNALMTTDKLFLDPELTISKLSSVIGISSKKISQIINQIENKNYSQYVATYRIKEAKRMLSLQEFKDSKIATIAYDSGFNNISSFNVTFKKITKTTAIEYRKSFLR